MNFQDTPPPLNFPPPPNNGGQQVSNPDTPPPMQPNLGLVRLEYDGNWVAFESKMSEIKITIDGQLYGKYKFKKPFTLEIPVYSGSLHIKATLGGIRSAKIQLNVAFGTIERVYLDYNRVWGSISLIHIHPKYFKQINL